MYLVSDALQNPVHGWHVQCQVLLKADVLRLDLVLRVDEEEREQDCQSIENDREKASERVPERKRA